MLPNVGEAKYLASTDLAIAKSHTQGIDENYIQFLIKHETKS